MLRKSHQIRDDIWTNPSPKTAGMELNEDSFVSKYINFEYVAALLVLVINLFFCSFYDPTYASEFQVVFTIYMFHHCRKFDDQILTNMTKWIRFIIDFGCVMFYIVLCNPLGIEQPFGGIVILCFLVLLCGILFIIFMDDPSTHLNKRENFRNRTSLHGMDRFMTFFVRFIPLCFMNGFFTLPLFLYSSESYFRMRWFVFFVMIYYWTGEFTKIAGDFAYMIRYIYVVLILSLNLVYLLVEGTPSSFEFVFSITLIVAIAFGWLISVALLFAMNLFPHEIWPHMTSTAQ